MRRRALVGCCAMLVALPAFAADPKPGREFTATAVVDTPQGTRRMPVTLVVDRFTSLEEADGLRTLLEKGGPGALLGALRSLITQSTGALSARCRCRSRWWWRSRPAGASSICF